MASARPIAFLTDFGSSDFYAGVMRAVTAAASPSSRLFDLAHDLPAHDIARASFVLARALDYVPADAVVVVVVDPGVGGDRRGLVVEAGSRTLVGPDNGFVSDLAVLGLIGRAIAIDTARAARSAGVHVRGATFHGRDIFAPVAAAIARGLAVEELGDDAGGLVMLKDIPTVSIERGTGARVRGAGRYIDRYGNVLSDIPAAALCHVFGTTAGVRAHVNGVDVGPLRATYGEGKSGELICILNSWDLVEAALNGGRAADHLAAADAREVRFELRGA